MIKRSEQITHKGNTIMRIGKDTASVSNWIMSSDITQPEVGKGMTELHWTDRAPWEVIYVSSNKKEVHVVRYDTKYKKDMYDGYQELDGIIEDTLTVLKYRHGAWRRQTDWGWSKMNVIFGCAQAYTDPHF
jgi:hypothetical protein